MRTGLSDLAGAGRPRPGHDPLVKGLVEGHDPLPLQDREVRVRGSEHDLCVAGDVQAP